MTSSSPWWAAGVPPAAVRAASPCSAAEFAALAPADLPETLAASSTVCLDTLWSFDVDVAAVVSAANVQALSVAIASETAALPASATRLTRLLYLFQIAFYHEFYQPALDYDASVFDTAAAAVAAVSDATAFYLESPETDALRAQWIVSIDSTMATHRATEAVRWMVQRYHDDPDLALDYTERVTAFAAFFTLARQVAARAEQASSSPWYGAISSQFLDLIASVGLDPGYTDDTVNIVENALYALAQFSVLDPPTAAAAHQALSDAFASFPRFSSPWFRALLGLEANFNAELADGTTLDLDTLRAEVTAFALPNTFVFGSGRTVFRTAVGSETAARLYDAMQEVKSQFFRNTGFLEPVPGDRSETLTLVVYASPGDYATYHPFLFGLPTNNGGIYIESDATLYTYDRTPQQSSYTLEELLRHEYVHYLVSRYLISGSWGAAGSLYDGGRMVWYDEGLAEFFAGSTRRAGVLPRATLVDLVANDTARMTIADILASEYGGGFKFYRYAGLLFSFLNSARPETLIALFEAVRADDAAGVDALWATLAADASLQDLYDTYLDARLADRRALTGVFAEDVPTSHAPAGLVPDNAASLRSTLASELQWPEPSFSVSADRYRYQATLSRTVTGTAPEAAGRELAAWLDGLLGILEARGPNFSSAVGWFGDLWTAGTTVNATVVVEGPYLVTGADSEPPGVPADLRAVARPGAVALSWTAGGEPDLAGYNVYRCDDPTAPDTPCSRVNASPRVQPEFVDTSIRGGGRVYRYSVTAVDASGNESAPSLEVTGSSSTNILVVNGYFDSGNDPSRAYTDVLDALGVGYDVWNPFVDGEPGDTVLSAYIDGMVVWAVGYYHSAYPAQLSAARQTVLTNYLDAGGSLVMSGAYLSNYADGTDLLANYFFVDSVSNHVGADSLEPTSVGSIGKGPALQHLSTVYQSEIDVRAPAVASYLYDAAGGSATVVSSATAVVTVEAGYRGVFLAFPFDTLAVDSRRNLLQGILGWLVPVAVAAPGLAGDVDGNGILSAGDALLALIASVQPGLCDLCRCDVNDDGRVSAGDALAILFRAVGASVTLGPPVCTPT